MRNDLYFQDGAGVLQERLKRCFRELKQPERPVAPPPALTEWRRDQTGVANKLPRLQKEHQCSRFNNPTVSRHNQALQTAHPGEMQLCLSSSITETPGISQKELSSLGGRLPQYLLLFLFSALHLLHHYSPILPPSLSPPLLSYAAIILSRQGVDVKAKPAVCVCVC